VTNDLVMAEPLVRCVDVARTFGEGSSAVVAVHGTTLEIRSGDRIAITGASGSGKSTLLHLLAGLETPTSGTVWWAGSLDGTRPAQDIGVVFQGPSLIPALDVVENTALPLLLAGVEDPEALERAQQALQRVGVGDLAQKLPEELSGGQAQRVAVARVLALRPRLVLADEPTGKLDRATGAHVLDVLLSAVDEVDAALVVSTHDPTVSSRLPQQWTMRDGNLTPRTSDSVAVPADGGGQR
jgi:ABC-type lipoprotein export system ATPase subunit